MSFQVLVEQRDSVAFPEVTICVASGLHERRVKQWLLLCHKLFDMQLRRKCHEARDLYQLLGRPEEVDSLIDRDDYNCQVENFNEDEDEDPLIALETCRRDYFENWLSPYLSRHFPKLAKHLSHSWSEVVKGMRFNHEQISKTELKKLWPFKFHMARRADKVSPGSGNCYSFNSDGDNFQKVPFMMGGLMISLKNRKTMLNERHSSCLGSHSCGKYWVLIHAPGTMPTTSKHY